MGSAQDNNMQILKKKKNRCSPSLKYSLGRKLILLRIQLPSVGIPHSHCLRFTIGLHNRRAFCMRMRASAERQYRGRIKSDGGKSKTRVKLLWIPYFPTKNVLNDKNRTFSKLDFSAVGFLDLLKTLKTQRQNHCSCIILIFTGKAMHFYGLISKLTVLLYI